jgi:glucose-6-phosphate 1-dehydrogenase
MPTGNGYRGLC